MFAIEPFNAKFGLRGNTSIAQMLFVFEPQRALPTKILCTAYAALVFPKTSLDVSRNACIQTAVGAANDVKTVVASAHRI